MRTIRSIYARICWHIETRRAVRRAMKGEW